MMGRTSTVDRVKERALSGKDLATQLAHDKKFRKQLMAAVGHGSAAKRRAKRRSGLVASVARVAGDGELMQELRAMTDDLRHAWTRVERKRSHRTRTTLLLLAAAGIAAAAAPHVKELLSGSTGDGSTSG